MNDLLRVEPLLGGRRNERVRHDVVDELGAHRAEKAEKIDLDRRWPRDQDSRSSKPRVSRQIDQNVDRVGVDMSRGLVVSDGAQVDEAVEGSFEPPAQPAAVIQAIRVPQDFKLRPIMPLDRLGDCIGYRVVAKVGREITKANPARRARAAMDEAGAPPLRDSLAPLLRAE